MSNPVTRRQALATLTGAVLATAASSSRGNTPTPPTTMSSIRHSVCKWCYPKIPLADLARAGAKFGLQSIELLGPKEWPVVKEFGLTCAISNGPSTIPDGFNRRENHAKLIPAFHERIRECEEAGIPNVICFSGNRRGQSDEEGLEICAEGIKQIVAEAEKRRVTVCMELLNSRVNHKDYQCDRTPWGVELCKRVGSERFKLLYDIYHMQIMEGDVIRTIQTHHTYFGHYHTGGNPGRNEIDETQELYYPAIMRAIKETGYAGFVGQEFIPKRDPLTSLEEAIKLCAV
ncbi:MAG: TIM barrel protein [Opitutaceae bacterium]|nr:TIM barrel protein [Opitutaceae bacterium]